MRVLVLDYGVGNLYSLKAALEREEAVPIISPELPARENFDALILPGVGNFAPVVEKLKTTAEQIHNLVETGLPILGICLGMQLLFDRSAEGAGLGLGLMSGEVVRLPSSVKVPHIGWNNLHIDRGSRLTEGISDGAWVYFVHSYYPEPADTTVVVAHTDYGTSFPAIVGRGNLYGTQFHPEKSGPAGRKLLSNFLEIGGQTCKS